MPARWRLPAEALADTRGFAKRSSPFFIVRLRPNRLGYHRVAVVVGAKVDRRSTERHALKRRLAERVRRAEGGRDAVITVLPPAKTLSRTAFMAEFERLFM